MCRPPQSSEHCHLLGGTTYVQDVIAVAADCDYHNDSSISRRWWQSLFFGRHKRNEAVVGENENDDDDDHRAHSRIDRPRNRRRDESSKRRRWSAILAGQTIAFALSCANAASSSLANDFRVAMPTLQTGLVYFLLSFHLAYLFFSRKGRIRNRHKYYRGDRDIICQQHDDDNQQTMDDDTRGMPFSIPEESNDAMPSSLQIVSSTMEQLRPNEITTAPYKFPFTNMTLHAPWQTYALLSVLDVEANYLAMLSFRHTTLSSSMLLTSLSVLSTVALRPLILPRGIRNGIGGRRMLGVALCLVGGCSWLRREFRLAGDDDDDDDDDDDGDDGVDDTVQTMMYGDLLALGAACIYGLNDVLAEYFLKASDDGAEYVGMLGLFGAIFSFCVQAPLLGEWDRARILLGGMHDVTGTTVDGSISNSTTIGAITLLLLCFVIMLFYFYTSAMAYLSLYDSTSLNLSLQTGPLWAVVLTMIQKSLTEEGNNGGWVEIPPAIFFISLTLIVVGMFMYESNSGNERNCCVVV